ncbi:uncharacterized protein Z518_00920 [Rhinocladiella mackenziei CBS 650.93]|uniref:Fungal-type protein kinase domain-containing protein n=1 Tax=Rhinocladiella mackenziei CBS 650.93 TaxID=1442369 RepID=A0A0D2IUR2_9EURO|nr:uncharacterized protein Z518_00920 [Rhinocladiella mackenziei CBS 650.93]KIX09839.1 hypothetical protein Z518_00920 [Rhinocladiella mackenziei CBS 650.93]
MNPPAAPPSRPRRRAAPKALDMVHNTYGVGTKRPRNTSAQQTNKTRKRKRDHTPSHTPSQDDDTSQYKPTPTHKRMPSHSGLVEEEDIDEIEHRILAEARGITRKNIPYDTFRSTFLSRFKHKDKRPQLNIQDIKDIGTGEWEQNLFFQRMQKALPKKADVELVFEHTQSPIQKASEKFLQWLRSAWNVFYHQPFRHYLYGILFLKSYALITYVDHGSAGYSEPLDFVKKPEHTQFLADFLADFIAEPEHRGRDPHVTAHQQDGSIFIEYAGITWTEVPDSLLCYRPCVFGRHLRVTRVHPADSPNDKWVMKDAWEEKVEHPSPPPEEEVISILVEANVRGIPQLHESTSRELLQQAKEKRKLFNECTDMRRRRARLIISYCQPLKEAMRNARPKELMRTIRDAMIVYYEAYKRPEHGFLHGDISIENIMVPVKETQLTSGLTHKTLRGTLIDWNLCFTTDGRASSRNIRSGTVAFMAPDLLLDDPVARRTLGHDMESFFAVMLWVASLDYDDEIAFQNKPLVELMIDTKSPTKLIAGTKLLLFTNPNIFDKSIIGHLEEPYREDDDFIDCIWDLRGILYGQNYDENVLRRSRKGLTNPKKEDDDDDPMKERLFKDCMAVFDKYLGDEGKQSGSYRLNKIDAGEDLEESEESIDTDLMEDESDDTN